MSDEIHVKISGSAVYRAVANYLKNSEELKQQIKDAVEKVATAGNIEAVAYKQVQAQVSSYYVRDALNAAVKQVLNDQIKAEVNKIVTEMVKKSLDNAVFLMPKLP